jgi:hypothetical protein
MDLPHIDLTRRQYAIQQRIDHRVLAEALDPELVVHDTLEHMVIALKVRLLTEPAGGAATDYVTALLPLRPRWLPRFLWRRIPTRSVRWTLSARPEWSYPRASVVPDMGDPVRIVLPEPIHVEGDPRWR